MGLDQNQLSGTIPQMANLAVLNATSNKLSYSSLADLPASLKVVYLANNSLTGTFPQPNQLPANLTVLDLSNNLLSGALPQALPANLTVLNVSQNQLTGSLPTQWQRLAELRLDDTALTGVLPDAWSEWGSNTSNSIQLSLVNNNLHGQVPRKWVEQFCLAVTHDFSEQVLFEPTPLQLDFYQGDIAHSSRDESVFVPIGSPITLVAQHASINVTLNGNLLSFSYQDPNSICGIPNAIRNSALLWGVFLVLILGTITGVHLRLRHKKDFSIPRFLTRLTLLSSIQGNQKVQLSKVVATAMWVFLTDVVWFVYSQVTDIITIHQVFSSGQRRYAFILLAILLLPFLLVMLLVARVCVKHVQSKIFTTCRGRCNSVMCNVIAIAIGLALSPFLFLALYVAMLIQAIGVSRQHHFLHSFCDLTTMYRAKSIVESVFNALPQAIIQTKLYTMGNDPNGIHVYINTPLFLASVFSSLASILSTIALLMIELYQFQYGTFNFLKRLIDLDPFV